MKINGSVSIEGRKGKKAVFTNIGPASFILGPCAMESRDHALMMAENLAEIGERLSIGIVYKTSFDKANRTSSKGYRGLPLDKALRVFEDVRVQTGLPTLTDVHLPEQCSVVAEVVDILQIPAFLCRQTDILQAAAATDKVVNVKKGQFLAPWDMKHVISKLTDFGAANIMVTERGTSFGYNTLVSDMRALPELRTNGVPVIFDATHSVQQPGGKGASSGGQRQFAPVLARAAMAVGIGGVFMETHQDPDNAPSDGPNMIPLSQLEEILTTLIKFDKLSKSCEFIN
ncbi:3-deoxy-8-phosphooctulonate synthase [Hellea sp.]|nr:3-deoxy-8-phosphooctulonate synthase [Hellea sp.]MDB4843915.1 3-deoxy-8-phosphooctulonate synthase [Hellea sp.]MDC1061719.1 3-deoxy-8-phosphooctulonate synthase [Hellea sp.]